MNNITTLHQDPFRIERHRAEATRISQTILSLLNDLPAIRRAPSFQDTCAANDLIAISKHLMRADASMQMVARCSASLLEGLCESASSFDDDFYD